MSILVKGRMEPYAWAEYVDETDPRIRVQWRVVHVYQEKDEKVVVFKDETGRYFQFPESSCEVVPNERID